MAPVLAYWDIRAIAEPIRLMLRQAGVEFEDKRYVMSDDYVSSDWFDSKFKHGFDFPNLPYYVDGNTKITHSLAIMRHLARKHNLGGDTPEEIRRVDVAEQQGNDLRWAMIRLILNPSFESLKADYLANLPDQLKLLNAFLKNGPWAAGDKLTYADFILYEALNQHLYLAPNCLDGFDHLKNLHRKVEALPNIKEYLNSEKFIRWPLFGTPAQFGGKRQAVPPRPVV